MADIRQMQIVEPRSNEAIAEVICRASKYVIENPCDEIVIVVQRKAGGANWFGCDESTVASTTFLLQGALHHLLSLMFSKDGSNG